MTIHSKSRMPRHLKETTCLVL
ncbi:hypothetical protein Gorai_017326 [Gossypium raimondii]|uniref:Uncharacterized protein n=1 Tax=Gossypium raimondii TaxID=29730 RepID=A0A7J8PBE6_GOSRA|nr:hypothetical protein [Gossypium raimondii]